MDPSIADVEGISERKQVALRYAEALDAVVNATEILQAPLVSWLRAAHRLQQLRDQRFAAQALAHAKREAQYAEDQLVNLAAGAGSEWGILSHLGSHSARTIESILCGLVDQRAQDLYERLPAIRADVELGRGHRSLARAEQDVAALARDFPVLHDLLPLHARPKVQKAGELERDTHLIRILITEREPDWDEQDVHIKLHDIVSLAQGSGLGTAALRELCAYADQRSLPIVAEFVPGFSADDSTVLRLASWYYRNGFRQGTRLPQDWRSTGYMRRDPSGRR